VSVTIMSVVLCQVTKCHFSVKETTLDDYAVT
jgi:hypothetical protein